MMPYGWWGDTLTGTSITYTSTNSGDDVVYYSKETGTLRLGTMQQMWDSKPMPKEEEDFD